MQHDLLFSVGGDLFTLSLPSDVEPMPEGLPLIHLDLDPWEIGKNYPAQVAIQGDPKATLPELVEALRRRLTASQAKDVTARVEKLRVAQEARREALRQEAASPGQSPPDQPARAGGRDRGRGARRGHHRGRDHLLEPRGPRAAARPRPPRLLRPARRRHRLGPARLDRREAGPAQPAGDRAGRRRQRHVHDPVALDGRPRLGRGGLRDLQQPVLPHPQAAHPGAQGLLGRGQRVRGDGPGQAGARLRGPREGAGRARRDGGEGGRRRPPRSSAGWPRAGPTWWTSASTARSAAERGGPARRPRPPRWPGARAPGR